MEAGALRLRLARLLGIQGVPVMYHEPDLSEILNTIS